MRVYLPRPYGLALVGRTVLVARPAARDFALAAIGASGSLFGFAARHAGAKRLEGRGPAYAVPAPGGHWVVRHFRRGGAMARWLEDCYLAVGVPRPVEELLASDAVARRGLDTPEVAALAVYPAGAFYRADIATAFVPNSTDLASALFGDAAAPAGGRIHRGAEVRDQTGAQDRIHACTAAGRLVGSLADRGVVHRDLNLKNILLEWTSRPPRPYLLDLDRCAVVAIVSARQRRAMLCRFQRSMRKWESRTGRALEAAEHQAFMAAYDESGRND